MVRHQLFPQKPPGLSLWFLRTGFQPFPGLSMTELPSAFVESGAYPPDRALPGSPRPGSLPLACRHPPEEHQIGARKRRAPGNTNFNQPYRGRVSTDRLNREGSQLAVSLGGESGPTPAGKTLPHSYPKPGFGGRGYILYHGCIIERTISMSPGRSRINPPASGSQSPCGGLIRGCGSLLHLLWKIPAWRP